MANTKVTQHVIADDAITTSMITDGNVTVAKLPSTVDLSSKTLTLPAITIPSASTATTQSQSDGSTKVATTAYVDTAVSNLIDSAPGTMNTLNEIAAALNDDANFNTTVTNSIAAKLPLSGGTMTGDIAHASNFTIDVGGNIDLDADGSHIIFSDGGTEFGRISHESTNLALYSLQGDGDLKFAGVPSGGSSFYALTLDMSSEGRATFNEYIITGKVNDGRIYFNASSGYSPRIQSSTNDISIYTNNSERLKIDNSGHITPGADNAQDLGTNSKRFRNIYSADLQLSNVDTGGNDVDGSEGSWTIQEGENDLFIINRKNGKKYKFNLEEVE